ncbi:MAG: hypothetical protein AB7O49_03985 [Sphingomonadales bacterium]
MILLLLLIVAVLAVSIRRPGGIVAFPTVFSALLLFWLMPQLWAVRMSSSYMQGISNPFVIMAGLCLCAAVGGWLLARPRAYESQAAQFDLSRYPAIIPVTIGLTLVSVVLAVLLEGAQAEMDGVQQWSGRATIIAFLAQLRIVPFGLALLLFLKRRDSLTTGLLIVNAAIILPVALLYMRRSEMVDLAIVSLGVYWFARRRAPRLLVVAMLVVPIFAANFAIGELRTNAREIYETTGDRPWITSPDLWSRFDIGSVVESNMERAVDVLNGIYYVAYTSMTNDISWGARTWNAMVFQFVPAQIFGPEVKFGMMIGDRGTAASGVESLLGHHYRTGTTSTGIGSAFMELSYFGCLIFALIGYVMGRLYRAASAGGVWPQIMYLVLLPVTLLAMTHGHEAFFTNIPLFAVITYVCSRLSRYDIAFSRREPGGRPERLPA